MHPYYYEVPQSPFDMAYGTSLLPRQLLVSSPYVSTPTQYRTMRHPNYLPMGHINSMSTRGYDSPLKNNSPSRTSSESESDISRAPTRRLILSSVDKGITTREFLDHVKHGPIESIRLVEAGEYNSIVLTFLKVETCLNFYNNLLTYLGKFKHLINSPGLSIHFVQCKKLLPFVVNAISNEGATRCLFVGGLSSDMYEVEPKRTNRFNKENEESDDDELEGTASTEKAIELYLRKRLAKFGSIDQIEVIRNKDMTNSFIHFNNVISAIKAVEQLPLSTGWSKCKVFYGVDRCCSEFTDYLDDTIDELDELDELEDTFCPMDISSTLNQKTTSAMTIATTGGMDNIGNRTICIYNLEPRSTVADLLNVVRGGLVQFVKFLREKHMCFITFIEADSAAQFFANSNIHPIILHSKRLKIGWGKHSGLLPNSIALSVTAGASRNVYIGLKDDEELVIPDESTLRKDFTKFGDIEQINFIKDNKAVFINFLNIANAIKLVDDANGVNEEQFHDYFEDRYRGLKINYGKDRCGNPPKVKKKKKKTNRNQKPEEEHSENEVQEVQEVPIELFESMGITQNDDETDYPSSSSSQLEIITTKPYTPRKQRPKRLSSRSFSNTSRSRSFSSNSRSFSNGSVNQLYPSYSNTSINSYDEFRGITGSQVMAQYLAQSQHKNMTYAANVLTDDWDGRRRRH
jgi:hypothetical protein